MSRLCYLVAFTKNFDAMRVFYTERVGLGIRQQEPRWVALETGGACLGLPSGPLQHALDPAGRSGEEETLDPAHGWTAPTPVLSRKARRARRVT